jgi:CRISPR-associated endonuclease Cas2
LAANGYLTHELTLFTMLIRSGVVAMSRAIYLFGYDISDNGNRTKALRLLRACSASYQDSVFEITAHPAELLRLTESLKKLLNPDCDRLLCIQLQSTSNCWQLGAGELSPIGDFLVIS